MFVVVRWPRVPLTVPIPIGLSALRLIRVEENRIYVQGIDLLDGTPILDIKPYVPYCDAFPRCESRLCR